MLIRYCGEATVLMPMDITADDRDFINGQRGLVCEVIMNTVIQDVHMKTWGFMDRVKDQTPIIRIDSLVDSPCAIHSIA